MTQEFTKPILTESATKNIESIFEKFSFEDIVNDIAEGKFIPNAGNLINKLIGLFFGELKSAFALVGSAFALVLLSAVINNLGESFGKQSISQASRFAVFVYIAAICATAFETAGAYVISTLNDITVFVHSIIPVMATMCASGGEIMKATMSHPVIYFVCSGAGMLIKNVITPLVLLRAVCSMLCAVTQNNGMGEFVKLFSNLHKTLLTFSMSIFAGILGISSFAGASFDSLAARGVKFAVSASVPMVGGSIAEAMSSVAGSAMLLKNAVGLAGVIGLFGMFALPLIKIWTLGLSFRLVAAFTAPVAESRTVEVLRNLGDCIDMLFSSLACMGTIMIIALASIL